MSLGPEENHFCWKEEKDLPARSPLDNSTQAANIDPVLSLPGVQPIICLISSDSGERDNSGGSSCLQQNRHKRGTRQSYQSQDGQRSCTRLTSETTTVPDPCPRGNNTPFELLCCSILCSPQRRNLAVEQLSSRRAQHTGCASDTLPRNHRWLVGHICHSPLQKDGYTETGRQESG